MKSIIFQGKHSMQGKDVKDPKLVWGDDIIVRITFSAICSSGLHIYKDYLPSQEGYVVGYEPMGIVKDAGKEVTKVKKCDRVALPFNIAWNRIGLWQGRLPEFQKKSVVR